MKTTSQDEIEAENLYEYIMKQEGIVWNCIFEIHPELPQD